jgi:hypothetical protein
MRPRKRYRSTEYDHPMGLAVCVSRPDGTHLVTVTATELYPDSVERVRADAGLIVRALNAYAKRG